MEVFAKKGGSAILLMLPQDFSSRLIEWGQNNIPASKLSGLPNKGYDKSPHITLATGIIDEAPEKAFKLLEKQEPFEVTLGEIGCFKKEDKGYDVIKIDIVSPILEELNASILNDLEVNDSTRPYSPHITLAYVKPFMCDDIVGNNEFEGMEVPVKGYVYSDREKGGKIVPFKKKDREPLKESLDYGVREYSMEQIKSHMENGSNINSISSRDMGRTIISIYLSNKTV